MPRYSVRMEFPDRKTKLDPYQYIEGPGVSHERAYELDREDYEYVFSARVVAELCERAFEAGL